MQKFLRSITSNPKNDILSGLTVALALVPEAVAFAFVADLDPMIGLYGAFMVGLITAIFGGRPGMISGATGAMAVVMVPLIRKGNEVGDALSTPIENLGVQWLFITLLVVGVIQMSAGVLRLGKFVRLIPKPVMMGFVNGLAIVIFKSQLGMFQSKGAADGESSWLQGSDLYIMIGLVALTMAIMYLLPKITKSIPAGLAAIVVVASITIFGGIEVSTVGSFINDGGGDGIGGGLPTFQSGIFGVLDTMTGHWKLILSTAAILSAVGLIESLMTLTLVDEITETRGSGNKECVAQGASNLINGLFGGMGGCAMIGQSMINVNSGGRGRLSGIMAAVALLCFILFGSSLIEQIPMAALVGVMMMVVIGTFAWSSFRILHKIPISDALVLITVSTVTVFFDLAIAVLVGVIISALVFAWENATRIRARKRMKDDGTKVYEIWGPLFFGSAQTFNTKFDPATDPQNVEIDFIESKVSDQSGVEALRSVANKYLDRGKSIKLTHLSPDCKRILMKANPRFAEVIETSVDDPRYYVVADIDVDVQNPDAPKEDNPIV